MATLKNQYKQKGFKEVHSLSEFLNVPSILNRAVNKSKRNELRKYGITPLNNYVPVMKPAPVPVPESKEVTERNKKKLEASIVRSLNWNNNDNEKFFGNLGRNRTVSNASDPKSLSRNSSPSSFKGGRKTRKARKQKRRPTRKH
jgi:hypothetical protein